MLPILSSNPLRVLVLALAGMITLATATAGQKQHPFTPLSVEHALFDAHALASRHDGAQVVRLVGASMLPFFGDGAVAVMRPIEAVRLRAGMIVVYRNRFDETVAHRLEGNTDAGWEVRGYANDCADSTLVTADNLLGVVYATFYSSGRIDDTLAAVTLLNGTVTALAAPAR